MDLVIATDLSPLIIEHQAGGAHLVLNPGPHGDGAPHQPEAVTAGRLAEKFLEWSPSLLFAVIEQIPLMFAHEGKVFR